MQTLGFSVWIAFPPSQSEIRVRNLRQWTKARCPPTRSWAVRDELVAAACILEPAVFSIKLLCGEPGAHGSFASERSGVVCALND